MLRRGLCGRFLTGKLPFCGRDQAPTPRFVQLENVNASDASHNCWHQSSLSAFLIQEHSSRSWKGTALPDLRISHASLGQTARSCSSSNHSKEPQGQANDETTAKEECLHSENQEGMGSFMADIQLLPVSIELHQAQQCMITSMRRCSYALFAVGATHFVWGAVLFLSLKAPLNHAVMTGVFISSVVFCGLAYQIRQGTKPIQMFSDLFFINPDEYHDMRVIFLSRKITRMLAAVFHRGRGIAFVSSLTIGAHALSLLAVIL